MFTLVPMATAPPSLERLELGPGVFWLRSKVFHCCVCPELSVTSLCEERARRRWMSPGRKEREKARGGEKGGTKKIQGWAGTGWGEGEKPRALHHCWSRVKKGRI